MFKRVTLFIAVNICVMVVASFTISLITKFFGLGSSYGEGGINYGSLMTICMVWGMAGSFVSLFISKWMAKSMYGVKVMEPHGSYGSLVQKVHLLAKRAGISKMPEVGVYESPEANAFATGASKNNSLVAVSTGLLNQMSEDEVEGVLAHEIAHIANGDMVTMALVQGVVNAFVMFFARIVTFAIDNFLRGEDEEEGGGLGFFASMFVNMGLQILFGFLAAPIVMGFSRWREYRADAGSAQLAGKEKMIAALEALKRNYNQLGAVETSAQTMQISSKESFLELFSSHPPLEKRIKALKKLSR
jgi:heat shock protein HtpX